MTNVTAPGPRRGLSQTPPISWLLQGWSLLWATPPFLWVAKGWFWLPRFIRRRLMFLIPQLFLVAVIAFFMIELIPGDPADIRVGALAREEDKERIRVELGLRDPMIERLFVNFMWEGLLHGNLGRAEYTTNPVVEDVGQRLPATMELISISLGLSMLIMIPLGMRVASPSKTGKMVFFDRYLGKVIRGYGLLAGSLADFWLALLLIFIFYVKIGVAPEPAGALSFTDVSPPSTTNFLILDSIIHGSFGTLLSYLKHLTLPVITLVFVYGGPILKMVISAMAEIQTSRYLENAQAMGLKTKTLRLMQFRNALPPVITIIGVIYGFLLGGAVLVERIFGLSGFGNYGIEAVLQADFQAVQGFLIVSAIFVMAIYFIVDVLQVAVDPRIRT